MAMDVPRFTELLRRNAKLIHRIALVHFRDAADREDAVQEIAVQLWRSRDRYDESFRETTWVYRIAHNVAISFRRRERRHRERRVPGEAHLLAAVAAPELEPSEELQHLLRSIEALGALEKALVLLYLDGNDHASIAEVLGISVSNVGTKLSRIKEKLRGSLEARARNPVKERPNATR